MSQHTRVFQPRLLEVFQNYSLGKLGSDVAAGVTVGLIALPLALALGIASIKAGTPVPYAAPAIGLFTAIIAGFLISVFSGSRVQIGGPTAAFIPIVLLVIEQHGFDGLLLATVMAGCLLVLMGLTKLGSLIRYIPHPVTSGFTTGIAISIMATQLADFFGIRAHTPAPREFLDKLRWFIENASQINSATLLLAIGSLLLILFWPKFALRRIPGSIIATVAATLLVAATGWSDSLGITTIGTQFPGGVPSELPPFRIPEISLDRLQSLMPAAIAIALLSGIESLLSAVVADSLAKDRHNSNTELIAQGIANIVCPFFCGLPATGAIARTTANINSGATSPISGITHAFTLLLIVLLFAPLAKFIPMAAMAAVLIYVSIRMGQWKDLLTLKKIPRSDALVLVATLLFTVLFDLVVAVQVGMVLAAFLFIRRIAATTEVSAVTTDDALETHEQIAHGKTIPAGVLTYRVFGPLLFGASEKLESAILALPQPPRVLILRLQLVTAMDATALNSLRTVTEHIASTGGHTIISGIHRQPLELMRKAGFIDEIGRENLCAHFDDALARARHLLASEEN